MREHDYIKVVAKFANAFYGLIGERRTSREDKSLNSWCVRYDAFDGFIGYITGCQVQYS